MSLYRDHTQTFIIRIWREPREIEGRLPEWRGVIEHVASGQRCYLTATSDISRFILPYLITMGVKLPLYLRLARWFKRIQLHPKNPM